MKSSIFMGTDEFCLPSLERLARLTRVVLVITQPDRPRGRGLKKSPSPVKVRALEMGMPVCEPEKLKDDMLLEELRSISPDIGVVCAYGKIIPKSIFTLPPLGCINIHPSLLPKYRGATPIESAIMEGEAETGVTTMFLDEGCDTGDIILQRKYPIDPEDTGGTLRKKLAEFSALLLEGTITLLLAGGAARIPQDRDAGSYTRPFKAEDLFIKWDLPAVRVRDFVRALAPKPAAHTWFRKILLKVTRVAPTEGEDENAPPGTILRLTRGRGYVVQTGRGAVELLELQPEGRSPMSGWDFAQGHKASPGDVIGIVDNG